MHETDNLTSKRTSELPSKQRKGYWHRRGQTLGVSLKVHCRHHSSIPLHKLLLSVPLPVFASPRRMQRDCMVSSELIRLPGNPLTKRKEHVLSNKGEEGEVPLDRDDKGIRLDVH